MNEKILKWLFDVQLAIQEIESYFTGSERDFNTYKNNTMLKRAVERNLEIIGEVIKRIINAADAELKKEITNAKAIIGLRNQVIHAYDNISDENIWSVLTNHLPKLKSEVSMLIEKSDKGRS